MERRDAVGGTMRFLALLSILFVALFPVSAAAGPTVEQRILAEVNEFRADNGLPPLRSDRRLAGAARAHAGDMADNDFFAHRGSDDSNSGQRARRAGYGWRAVGENIAGGLESPAATVAEWVASEGHRQNMLNPAFRDAGIGYAYRAADDGLIRYRHYWVLLLGTLP